MSKFIMFLMAATFSVAATAQTLVYDYKASYEAVGTFYQKVKYSVDGYDLSGKHVEMFEGYFDTFDVVKDSLKGYLVIESCYDCGEGSDQFPMYGDIYVQRKGDKLFQDIYVMEVMTDAAMFNKGVGSRLSHDDATELAATPTSLKKLKKAWMTIEFPTIPVYHQSVEIDIKQIETSQYAPYGFLGYQNIAVTDLKNCGYGKVSIITNKGSSSIGFCGTEIIPGSSCTAVQNISGTLCGMGIYIGICNGVPMWDICDITTTVPYAPMTGKWSVKLNKKLSSQYVEEGEDAILAKFKKYGDVIYVPTGS